VHDVVVVVTVKGARRAGRVRLFPTSLSSLPLIVHVMDAIPEDSPIKTTAAEALNALDTLDVVSWANLVLSDDYESLGGVAVKDAPSMPLSKLDRRLANLIGALDNSAEETARPLERALDELARTALRLT
jgi:hypothetical protein